MKRVSSPPSSPPRVTRPNLTSTPRTSTTPTSTPSTTSATSATPSGAQASSSQASSSPPSAATASPPPASVTGRRNDIADFVAANTSGLQKRARDDGSAATTPGAAKRPAIDLASELQFAMETAAARGPNAQGALDNSPAHLNQQVEVGGKPRRRAEIREPRDAWRLSGEPKVPGDNHYTQLTRPRPGGEPLVTGRMQDPVQRGAADDERFLYQQGMRGPPTYPQEARHLADAQKRLGLSDRETFQAVKDGMLGRPLPDGLTEAEQRSVHTTGQVISFAEQRRNAYMGLTSAQRIDHAAQPGATQRVADVLGRREGKTNKGGTLPASGTGAKAVFRDVSAHIEQRTVPPEGTEARRVYDNIAAQHGDLMQRGFSSATAERLRQDGMPAEDIEAAQLTRMRSAATRDAAKMVGQLPYDLRPLKDGDGGSK